MSQEQEQQNNQLSESLSQLSTSNPLYFKMIDYVMTLSHQIHSQTLFFIFGKLLKIINGGDVGENELKALYDDFIQFLVESGYVSESDGQIVTFCEDLLFWEHKESDVEFAEKVENLVGFFTEFSDVAEVDEDEDEAFEFLSNVGQCVFGLAKICGDKSVHLKETSNVCTAVVKELLKFDVNADFVFMILEQSRVNAENSGDKITLINILEQYGDFYVAVKQMGLAKQTYTEMLAINEENPLPTESLVKIYKNLGAVCDLSGETEQGRSHIEKSLEILLQSGEDNKELLADIYNELGVILLNEDQFEESMGYFRKCLELNIALYGESNINVVTSYSNLGSSLSALERYEEAEESFIKSKDLAEGLFGETHDEVSRACSSLGSVYYSMGDLDQALTYHEKSLEIDTVLSKKEDKKELIAATHENLGNVYSAMGNLIEAKESYQTSLDIQLQIFPDEFNSKVAETYNHLGLMNEALGNFDEAITLFEKNLEIETALENNSHVASVLSNLGTVYKSSGDIEKAVSYFNQSLEKFKSLGEENTMDLSICYSNLGAVAEAEGNLGEAKTYYKQSLDIELAVNPEPTSDLASSYSTLASLCSMLEENIEAKAYYEQCLTILRSIYETDYHEYVASTLINLGVVSRNMEDEASAKRYETKAHEIEKILSARTTVADAIARAQSQLDNNQLKYAVYSGEEALREVESLPEDERPINRVEASEILMNIHLAKFQQHKNIKDLTTALTLAESILELSKTIPELSESTYESIIITIKEQIATAEETKTNTPSKKTGRGKRGRRGRK
eukprot:TRINITY_DN3161_c0_g1_i1.p1 TRINITY_DN3161_c0_g1~~TRINITY_DN3161_c0_g1_i1.p1  ORF type:complete len:805 (+),score=232.21 TRINITY_DN3161_c0_g1_i1:32-2416(+)